MTVAAILKHKGHEVVGAEPGQSVAEAVRLLSEKRIGAVPVLSAGRQLLGILSERDIVHALAAHGAEALEMRVSALMTRDITIVTPSTTVAQAMELMTSRRFRHLPVLDGGRLAGIVSIGDVVKARLDAQAIEVDSLKAYVAGD